VHLVGCTIGRLIYLFLLGRTVQPADRPVNLLTALFEDKLTQFLTYLTARYDSRSSSRNDVCVAQAVLTFLHRRSMKYAPSFVANSYRRTAK
jgi:hypothetical protein